MSALFFYAFVYLIGYYGSHVLNMLTVRPWIRNRYLAALIPVYLVGIAHAYMVVSKPPPQGQDITVEYALSAYIAMPLVVVTMGAIYAMWRGKAHEDDS